ncbi:uncharacterized protein LOC135941535 [Cloeon dipterum]|uniref:uncharacterized protein LOC135941535 n=1 Tax=Cloeon dipterum TaxID=197152 RepID=UPI003220554C
MAKKRVFDFNCDSFLPKISKGHKIGSNVSMISTSSRLSLAANRQIFARRPNELPTQSVDPALPRPETDSNITAAKKSSNDTAEPSTSKMSHDYTKPGPSTLPEKHPLKRVSPSPPPNKHKSPIRHSKALIDPPIEPALPRSETNCNNTAAKTAKSSECTANPSSSKLSLKSPKPGPSTKSAKSPLKRACPGPSQNRHKSPRHSEEKRLKRLPHPIHELLDEEFEEDEAPLPKVQKTPSKSPRKRVAKGTPSKAGPSPAKSYRKSPRKPLDALGFCKICQLPLVCIKIPEYQHTRECEVPDDSPECPDGVECKSCDRTHYTQFKHTELALLRANDSDVKVINEEEPPEEMTVEPDLPGFSKKRSKRSNKVGDNPFLSDSEDGDNDAHEEEEEEHGAEVGSNNQDVEQEEKKDSPVQPCVGGVCDENKVSVSFTANGETIKFCANDDGWEDNDCNECSGLVSSTCRCGRNLVVQTKSKEAFYKKQMEAKKKWASNPIMNKQRSKDSSAASLSSVPSVADTKSRGCPSYKLIRDTSFAVDAFSHGKIPNVKFHFLSHFHYDHYIGLNKHFSGIIYCSQITANLVKHHFKFGDRQLRVLPMDETIVVDGVKVTALDANHCPGAVMLLFQLLDGTNVVHTGDFRFSPSMESYSAFWNIQIDVLHLDTTYCNEKYDFESQEEILQLVGNLAEERFQLANKKCLFVCGSYTIGKEKVFLEIARKLNSKIYAAEPGKKKILKMLDDPHISEYMVEKSEEANIHVLPNGKLHYSHLSNYLNTVNKKGRRFTSIVAFNPTGWQHSSKRIELYREQTSGNITIFGVPYSEHSSFSELKRFVKFLKPRRVIPTVRSKGCSWQDISMKCNNWLSEGKL